MSQVNPTAGTDARAREVPQDAVDVTLGADFTFSSQSPVVQPRALWIGTGGNVVASLAGTPGTYHTFKNIPSGTLFLGAFAVVRSTGNGTTAADIIALL